jgi:hypothetical protein
MKIYVNDSYLQDFDTVRSLKHRCFYESGHKNTGFDEQNFKTF